MIKTKQKLVVLATTLVLGCGLTVGSAPAFSEVNDFSSHRSLSSVEKEEQQPFTGYVISIDDIYMIVADTPTKEEALSYKDDWWELALQNKILKVPVSSDDAYVLGAKLNVYANAWTNSIPPIAIAPTIEKISE